MRFHVSGIRASRYGGWVGLQIWLRRRTDPGHPTPGAIGGTNLNAYEETSDAKFRQAAIGYAIDDFVRTSTPTRPTHLKIEVDGIEADLLRGGENTLKIPSVQSVLIEIMGDIDSPRNAEIISVMTAFGFSARPKKSPDYRNVIVERRDT